MSVSVLIAVSLLASVTNTYIGLARCARGDHDVETKYGVCGIITAVVCFPCGLICLL